MQNRHLINCSLVIFLTIRNKFELPINVFALTARTHIVSISAKIIYTQKKSY